MELVSKMSSIQVARTVGVITGIYKFTNIPNLDHPTNSGFVLNLQVTCDHKDWLERKGCMATETERQL